jgi:hypothetical protein
VTTPSPTPDGTKPYEERDVSLRPIVATAVFLVVLMTLAAGLMWVLDRMLFSREAARSAPASPLAGSYGRLEPPAPRLQARPRVDLDALRAREQALLDGYAWTDRAGARVRIPVARAMELLATEDRR